MKIDQSVQDKLSKRHIVSPGEVKEAFENRKCALLVEVRPEHVTTPRTLWFLSRTSRGRILKVAYIERDGETIIKSAYEPLSPTIDYYCKAIKKDQSEI